MTNLRDILILLVGVGGVFAFGYVSHRDSVDAVLDANTLELGRGRNVHLIGIEAVPDVAHVIPATGDASHAPSASGDEMGEMEELTPADSLLLDRIADRIGGKTVRLEFIDDYERDIASPDLFAYLRLDDGSDLGAWIITQGYGRANDVEHPRGEQYRQMEQTAREAGAGLWFAEQQAEEPSGQAQQ